jgi:hypothetical protein
VPSHMDHPWRRVLDVAKSEPLEPQCVGTGQLTSETCATSKPVPEGNVWHQGLAPAAPGSFEPGAAGGRTTPQLAATAPSCTGLTGPPDTRTPATA